MNEQQLISMYRRIVGEKGRLSVDPEDNQAIEDALDAVKASICRKLQDLVWGEYYATELKPYDT